jgi:hypothetical protein
MQSSALYNAAFFNQALIEKRQSVMGPSQLVGLTIISHFHRLLQLEIFET